ncbi:hypothetical protein, partial [Armatimonas sp.]|uniref:hypothetical protein n=1 Tax=Armatimonas sp. TaxID=1872638 RepID=UPI00286A5F81
MSMETSEDRSFVTVSELARALDISPRQASRWMARAAVADRDTTASGQSRVRLAAVVALREATVIKKHDRHQERSIEDLPSTVTDSDMTVAPDTMTVTRRSSEAHDDGHAAEASELRTVALDLIRTELETERRRASDLEKRAAVAEARAELLEKSLTDTQGERDRWASQAESLTEALQRAQDETRAARLIGGRQVQQIEAAGLTVGDSSGDSTPEGA